MSLDLFHLQKEMLETEISKFRDFLTNNLQEYEIPPADVSLLKEYLENLKAKLSQDIGQAIEDAVKSILVKEWKTIFAADNYIDEGKSILEQKHILNKIIEELKSNGKLTREYLPSDIVDSVNANFLQSNYKIQILIEELTSELNLCNTEIHWIDALCERIRVMFYSAFLIGDVEGIEYLIKKLIRNKEYIPEWIDLTEADRYYETACTPNDSFVHPLEQLIKKKEYLEIFEEAKNNGILPKTPITIRDVINVIILLCIGVAVSDDFMDIDEDTKNNKITGITRGIAEGVSLQSIVSTTIVYLNETVSVIETPKKIELWYIQLMSLMYQDTPECLNFCRNTSPYLFKLLFQRK